MDKIRIVIADDQILFLESLKIVIETVTADMTVVGTAHNGVEVVEVVVETLDISLTRLILRVFLEL